MHMPIVNISRIVAYSANITIVIKHEVDSGISIGILRLNIGQFQRSTWPSERCRTNNFDLIVLIQIVESLNISAVWRLDETPNINHGVTTHQIDTCCPDSTTFTITSFNGKYQPL